MNRRKVGRENIWKCGKVKKVDRWTGGPVRQVFVVVWMVSDSVCDCLDGV